MRTATPRVRGRAARGRDEGGFATVAALGMVMVLATVALAVAVGAALVVDHRRAQAAADLAALAGATALGGTGDACGAAASTAEANAARLASCEVIGRDVRVEVVVEHDSLAGRVAELRGTARAGPAQATGA
ncbi:MULTISPECIES: Rv3654c family TadE-like protein [unclassified Nocardioides]|uniref:Rv3654c family TadE-like protein n=1 Tax=unclassified Nocardioides TaxID=2615069 RepID=UPI0024060FAB|nr:MULTISPECIES: Rv3654c family TadE-like protein [unclassified Nocardioides]MDF9717093.1 hypothetical protein [Nocardioides sp. ChNu-99]